MSQRVAKIFFAKMAKPGGASVRIFKLILAAPTKRSMFRKGRDLGHNRTRLTLVGTLRADSSGQIVCYRQSICIGIDT